MVKADAYNHGLFEVVNATKGLADRFGVATAEEGANVRRVADNGITVFSYTADEATLVKSAGLTPVVRDKATLRSVIEHDIPEVDIKVDTGMHRFGFSLKSEFETAMEELKKAHIRVRAVHTHFYSADAIDRQYAKFCKLTLGIPKACKRICSASAGISKGLYLDGVRVGLMAYKGAMRVYSEIIAVREVSKGETVGYDGAYVAPKDTHIGIVGGGYYDGIMRAYSGADVIVNGKKSKIIGNVCMDVTFIELPDDNVRVGDEVTLIAPDTLESYMKNAQTNEYEVLTSVKGRTERRFIDNG